MVVIERRTEVAVQKQYPIPSYDESQHHRLRRLSVLRTYRSVNECVRLKMNNDENKKKTKI